MVPPIELAPYKVACGPRSTSTRSISKKRGSILPMVYTLPTVTGVSPRYTPTVAAPAVELMPRISIFDVPGPAPPLPLAAVNEILGTTRVRSVISRICSSCNCLPVTAEILIATLAGSSLRFCAVTVTTSIWSGLTAGACDCACAVPASASAAETALNMIVRRVFIRVPQSSKVSR